MERKHIKFEETATDDRKGKVIRKLLIYAGRKPEDIKKKDIDRLRSLKYKELIRPMVISDRMEKQLSRAVLARKYDVTEGTIKWILMNYA